MVVKKRANVSMESFIDKGADVKAKKDKSFNNVLIRMHNSLLSRIDESTKKKPWLNRTQWIVEAIIDRLKYEEKE